MLIPHRKAVTWRPSVYSFTLSIWIACHRNSAGLIKVYLSILNAYYWIETLVFSAAKIIPPYIKCLLLIIITCSFLQMFYRMRCVTRMRFMGLWRCKLKIIGGDDFGSAAKIIHPYMKCLLLIIITCAFLQLFYRMRCVTRMRFMGQICIILCKLYSVLLYEVYMCIHSCTHYLCIFFVLCNRLNVLLLLFLCTGKCLPLQLIIF